MTYTLKNLPAAMVDARKNSGSSEEGSATVLVNKSTDVAIIKIHDMSKSLSMTVQDLKNLALASVSVLEALGETID